MSTSVSEGITGRPHVPLRCRSPGLGGLRPIQETAVTCSNRGRPGQTHVHHDDRQVVLATVTAVPKRSSEIIPKGIGPRYIVLKSHCAARWKKDVLQSSHCPLSAALTKVRRIQLEHADSPSVRTGEGFTAVDCRDRT